MCLCRLKNTSDDIWFCFRQSIDADSEKEKVKEDIEEDSKEPSSTLASSEESTVLMAEMEISEEDAEAQEGKETNMDTIMQTSSDEEVKSRSNFPQGPIWISNIVVYVFLWLPQNVYTLPYHWLYTARLTQCSTAFRKRMEEFSGSETFPCLMSTLMQISWAL